MLHMLFSITLSQNHVSLAHCPASDPFTFPKASAKIYGTSHLELLLNARSPTPNIPTLFLQTSLAVQIQTSTSSNSSQNNQPASFASPLRPSFPLLDLDKGHLNSVSSTSIFVSPPPLPPPIHKPGNFARAGPRFPTVKRFTQDLLCFGCFFVRGGQSVRVSNVDPVDRHSLKGDPFSSSAPTS